MSNINCRFCGTPLEHSFCDLGMSPVSNSFVSFADDQAMEPFYPLHALVCSKCHLVQLGEFESAEYHFNDNYAYFSSMSDSWLAHAKAYTDKMMEEFGIDTNSLVIEVASNDGYLLQYFNEKNVPVLGVEPTANTAKVAVERGVPTITEFFGCELATKLTSEGKQADLLLGNNVLAHVPDINDFVGGMKIALAPGGIVTMEFPHLLEQIESNQFDTIYHEHYSYLSLLAVEQIFAAHRMSLFHVESLPTHGGSLRIFAKHDDDDAKPIRDSIIQMRDREAKAGLKNLETYASFQASAQSVKRELLKFLIDAKESGKTVVGYGAPAKGNTLLNYCGIRTDLVDFTVDRSPRKQNTFLPGVRIPVYAPEAVIEAKPDYVLILPWNLRDEVSEQLSEIRSWGGQFVVPIPKLEIF